ncbi:MAG: hypothetical protein MUC61_00155 [Amoebophilaceae bacterium]|nr:hypothetical protein [Amoebophilaceae bacterium]
MKKIQYLTYLLCLLVFSSNKFLDVGLDIYETGRIHDNGSGQLELVADLTNAEQLIQVASLLTKSTPDIVRKGVKEAFSEAADNLKCVAGVSNVTSEHNAKMSRFKLSFQFDSIKALNEAVRKLYTHVNHPGCTSFKMDRRSFARTDTKDVAQLLAHYYAKTDPYIANLISKTFLSVVTYHLAYSFDKEIKKATHALASISADRKTVLLTQSLASAQENELSLSNTISF